ncbi:MAG: hypothetical protein JJU02_04745 [Cryomorphaceae bacterium]|nr:hypothetical protein [Cryomorphaceae bacterium]
MRQLTTFLLTLFTLSVYGQTFKEMKPTLGNLVDKSLEGELEFLKKQKECEKFWKEVVSKIDEKDFTKEQIELNEFCATLNEGYWDIIGVGCSWYCGGGQDTLSASSELEPSEGNNYSAKNAHDLSYKTAWIEGVPGYGIGEYLTYHIRPQNPRITKVIIVNGYVKSEKTWKENSRVKKLKMYIDDKPFAMLLLEDTRQEQIFSFEPLGYSDRVNWDDLHKKPWWTMKFEIAEVYKGDKYDETAITEIYFDGIDVHCFGAGTEITLADNTTKKIEEITNQDWVLTYNMATNKLDKTKVSQLVIVSHKNLLRLKFSDREIIVTDDHPFWTDKHNWASVNPTKSNKNYDQSTEVVQLKIGDRIFNPTENRFLDLISIEKIKDEQLTYTIELTKGNSFIANGLLVKTEKPKWTN